jgi:hypothetical protein
MLLSADGIVLYNCSGISLGPTIACGPRVPLGLSPDRWDCAIHLLDAIFYSQTSQMSVPTTTRRWEWQRLSAVGFSTARLINP